MTEAEIKRIAEGLAPGMRRQMMDIGAGKVMESAMRHGFVSYHLISEGLLTFSRTWWLWGEYVFYLTPLGLAVRDYLEKSDG